MRADLEVTEELSPPDEDEIRAASASRADLEALEELSQGATAIAKALGIGRASVYRMLEA